MLTYVPPEKKRVTSSPETPWLLIFLGLVWLWPGVIHHDLWKPLEPYVYAAMQSVILDRHLFMPEIFGTPYVKNSPLYVWVASLFSLGAEPNTLLSYTMARLATVFFMVLGFFSMGLAGRRMLGDFHGRSVILILLGSPGIMIMGHLMGESSMMFAGYGVFLLGFTYRRKVFRASLLVATGGALAFLAGNLFPVIFMLLFMFLLPINREFRNGKHLNLVLSSIAMMAPLVVIWPLMLSYWHPEAFAIWWRNFALGDWGGFGNLRMAFYPHEMLEDIVWFALPAWILAIHAMLRKGGLKDSTRFFLLLWLVVATIMISLCKKFDKDSLMVMLLPMAFLGASTIDYMRRGTSAFLNWFGIIAFGLISGFIVLSYFAINLGHPAFLKEIADKYNWYYSPRFDVLAIGFSLVMAVVWLFCVTRRNIRGRQALTNWAGGMTFAWTLLLTLFLPWIDTLKSYRPLVHHFEASLPPEVVKSLLDESECIASNDVPALVFFNEYSMFDIFSLREFKSADVCGYRLELKNFDEFVLMRGGDFIWAGSRESRANEIFVLAKNRPLQAAGTSSFASRGEGLGVPGAGLEGALMGGGMAWLHDARRLRKHGLADMVSQGEATGLAAWRNLANKEGWVFGKVEDDNAKKSPPESRLSIDLENLANESRLPGLFSARRGEAAGGDYDNPLAYELPGEAVEYASDAREFRKGGAMDNAYPPSGGGISNQGPHGGEARGNDVHGLQPGGLTVAGGGKVTSSSNLPVAVGGQEGGKEEEVKRLYKSFKEMHKSSGRRQDKLADAIPQNDRMRYRNVRRPIDILIERKLKDSEDDVRNDLNIFKNPVVEGGNKDIRNERRKAPRQWFDFEKEGGQNGGAGQGREVDGSNDIEPPPNIIDGTPAQSSLPVVNPEDDVGSHAGDNAWEPGVPPYVEEGESLEEISKRAQEGAGGTGNAQGKEKPKGKVMDSSLKDKLRKNADKASKNGEVNPDLRKKLMEGRDMGFPDGEPGDLEKALQNSR